MEKMKFLGEVRSSIIGRGAYISQKISVNIRKIGHKRNQGLKDAKLYVHSLRHGVRHSIDD